MRATLDIDDDLLQVARELAQAEGKTAGKVLSELARKGLTQIPAAPGFAEEAHPPFIMKGGWITFTNREGVVVTKELADRLIEEADEEGARRKGGCQAVHTALDIDDDVLQAAEERARAEGKTAGQVVSELVRQALTRPRDRLDMSGIEIVDGIPVLPSRGVVVTHEQVKRLIEEADLEDARRALGK